MKSAENYSLSLGERVGVREIPSYKVFMKNLLLTLLFSIFFISISYGESATHFKVIPLGTTGGEFQDNLSSYLVAPANENEYVALDAGTTCSAIKKLSKDQLPGNSSPEAFFTGQVKAYLLSHAHLDHIAGLVLCSTIDSKKTIWGTRPTIDFLRAYIFNWKIWPNFADEGILPYLKIYHYQRMDLDTEYAIPQPRLQVRAFPLSHGVGYASTAFLLKSANFYLLYVGDTGADELEKSHDLALLWREIAPLIKSNQLTAIFIEASYPNSRPDRQLFGHLTPHWLLLELQELAKQVDSQNPQQALQNLPVVVTHIKQGLATQNNAATIAQQLNSENNLGIRFIIPKQGQELKL